MPPKRPKGLRKAQQQQQSPAGTSGDSSHTSAKRQKVDHPAQPDQDASAKAFQQDPVYIGEVADDDDEVGECAALLTAAKTKLNAEEHEAALPLLRGVIHECNRLVKNAEESAEATLPLSLYITFATALYYLAQHKEEADEGDEQGYLSHAVGVLERGIAKTASAEESEQKSAKGLQSCLRTVLAFLSATNDDSTQTVDDLAHVSYALADERRSVAWRLYGLATGELDDADACLQACRAMWEAEERDDMRNLGLGLCYLVPASQAIAQASEDYDEENQQDTEQALKPVKVQLDSAISHFEASLKADDHPGTRLFLSLAEAYTNLGSYYELVDSDEYKKAYKEAVKYYKKAVEHDPDCDAEEALKALEELL
ncbi:hypothetical protein RI367_007440 [Sorochytrium milnesiophthora]